MTSFARSSAQRMSSACSAWCPVHEIMEPPNGKTPETSLTVHRDEYARAALSDHDLGCAQSATVVDGDEHAVGRDHSGRTAPSRARSVDAVNPRLRSLAPNLVGIVVLVLIAAVGAACGRPLLVPDTSQRYLDAITQHIRLTLTTLVISVLIAVPLGTLVARVPVLYTPVIGLLGIIYTIPSLALFAILITYVGIGFNNAVIALVAYAQFILVRNVVVG